MNFCANNVNAEEYNQQEEYSFAAKKIVTVPTVDYSDEEISIYAFTDADGTPCLLFTCHSMVTPKKKYAACLGGKYYTNYAAVVDNEIRYHINRGEIRNGSFDRVYFLSCYSGYAPQRTVTMLVLRKKLQMILYNTNIEGIAKYLDKNDRVYYLGLYKNSPGGPPSSINASDARRIKIRK